MGKLWVTSTLLKKHFEKWQFQHSAKLGLHKSIVLKIRRGRVTLQKTFDSFRTNVNRVMACFWCISHAYLFWSSWHHQRTCHFHVFRTEPTIFREFSLRRNFNIVVAIERRNELSYLRGVCEKDRNWNEIWKYSSTKEVQPRYQDKAFNKWDYVFKQFLSYEFLYSSSYPTYNR